MWSRGEGRQMGMTILNEGWKRISWSSSHGNSNLSFTSISAISLMMESMEFLNEIFVILFSFIQMKYLHSYSFGSKYVDEKGWKIYDMFYKKYSFTIHDLWTSSHLDYNVHARRSFWLYVDEIKSHRLGHHFLPWPLIWIDLWTEIWKRGLIVIYW